MSILGKKRLAVATIVYWFLLTYILAALLWWFIALQTQAREMAALRLEALNPQESGYAGRSEYIRILEKRKEARNIGEGSIFLLVIGVGALFVYRAVRRQIKLQLQQQNFMMAVTHELKTPIAITRLNLETLQKHKLEEAKQQKIIQAALQETNRLNTLANNILVSAQLEGGRYQLIKDEIDFSKILTNTAAEFKYRFPDKKWEVNVEPNLKLFADQLLLTVLVNNLVENAVKYSPRDSAISIIASKKAESRSVVLLVKDQGPGIAPEERKRIFRKFYRIGSEATRSTQGTGLGLYITKKIAADHKANVSVSNNTPTGSIFAVSFKETAA